MKECIGEDGETYYEIEGNWFLKTNNGVKKVSKPKKFIKCKTIEDKKKTFWYKYLTKE